MILDQALGRPRASMSETELSWEQVQAWFQRVFFSGDELTPGQTNAERLSPVAAAHQIGRAHV